MLEMILLKNARAFFRALFDTVSNLSNVEGDRKISSVTFGPITARILNRFLQTVRHFLADILPISKCLRSTL